ncbi:hypothetical protein DRQ07_11095 [candidate division KSB1 bacterium]|nr:MAG: hypothetical protein DRQ07_11095 [candidate division KSB1 bacterium]
MEENNIDVLEEKINKIVAMINTLREENKKLKVYAEELKKSNMEKDEVIRKLNQERENIANIQNEIESYKSKHDRVRTKVDQLLLKLKEIDDIY